MKMAAEPFLGSASDKFDRRRRNKVNSLPRQWPTDKRLYLLARALRNLIICHDAISPD